SRRGLDHHPVEEGRLLLKEAMVPFRLGRYPATIRWLNRGIQALEGADGPGAAAERARLAVWYATTRLRQHRPEEAVLWCRRAIEYAKGAQEAQDALAQAYDLLDRAYLTLGRPDEPVYH